MDCGGHVYPTFFEDRFSNSSKFDQKLEGGGGVLVVGFSGIGTRFLPLVDNLIKVII